MIQQIVFYHHVAKEPCTNHRCTTFQAVDIFFYHTSYVSNRPTVKHLSTHFNELFAQLFVCRNYRVDTLLCSGEIQTILP
jgi:hypothetical protein